MISMVPEAGAHPLARSFVIFPLSRVWISRFVLSQGCAFSSRALVYLNPQDYAAVAIL